MSHGRRTAALSVRDAASRVEIRLVALPDLLYRITTQADSGLSPRVTGPPGGVRLALTPTGANGPDTVTIELNRTVRWDLNLPAGAGEQHLELAGGRISRIRLGSGAALVRLALPRPSDATVPITIGGAVGELDIGVPDRTAVWFRLHGGAGSVAMPSKVPAPAAPGAIINTHPGTHAAGYAVDIRSTVGALALHN
ncbi:hypothetical protein GCM10010435_02510 [Winogradskya consettensis]|uniref:Uncharacterized protein n=1 Tax=Winogradskya consettensis TaxID=113560 RepID=A0A919VK24_9ACTN|nr:hypothetical protein [Actinoplanes consettensis]GIM66098.1 hypothetical protein Aco04nite_00440 [Actinoplanes consettensis]